MATYYDRSRQVVLTPVTKIFQKSFAAQIRAIYEIKKCYWLPQDSLSHSVKLLLITSRLTQSFSQITSDPKSPIWTRQLEPKHLTNFPPNSAVTQSFTSIGVLQKYNFLYCCLSHRNGHTLRVLRRTYEIRDKMGQEGGTHYRHAGRDDVRLQPLARTEVTYLTSRASGNAWRAVISQVSFCVAETTAVR
jgi:hypothetical protein